MLSIVICEDEKAQRLRLHKFIETYIEGEELDMKIALSSENPTEVLTYAKENHLSSLYFLDVNLKSTQINGIQLAAQIRKLSPKCEFVFITSHPEEMSATFELKVGALDYIAKDNPKLRSRVKECILLAEERLLEKGSQKFFEIKNGSRIIRESYENILFFKVDGDHKIKMVAKNREATFYGKLSEIESKEEFLFRASPAYVINKNQVIELDTIGLGVKFSTGVICPVSVRKMGLLSKEMRKK